ncbi:MAG: alpha/beta hydrolase [Cyclobacteriaceae bacterium]|nr:alpha/beta hydrolase [Cyclobacteriaceae bacterium]MDX5466443.1 alpha/beta hydrolase [Cyclobacteriaceae bacterium]
MRLFLSLVFCLSFSFPTFSQSKIITTSDGVDLFVTVKGTGQPCLYIHGGPGSGSYWMEKFAGDLLESRFQMIYVDLRGVGRSASPKDGNYSMDRMVLDFEEIRKDLGIEQWILMGHSFSGTMLMGYALRNPNPIKGLMMFNTTLHLEESLRESWIPKATELLGLENDPFFTSDSVAMNDQLQRLFPLLQEKGIMWKLAYAEEENEKIMNATFGEIPNWNHDFSGVGMHHPDYLVNFKPFTAQIQAPVLFFYGEYDWTIGPNHFRGVQFPNLYLWKSKVGHMPFMENKPDLAKAIDFFLKKI